MLSFLFFIACVWAVIFLFIKLKKKFFDPFIAASPLRFSIWNWTKRVILLALATSFLICTFERWYYFHDDIAHSKKSAEIDLSYAEQIEIEAYLTLEEYVVDLFEGKLPLAAKRDLDNKPFNEVCYLVIRLKNMGDVPIYGALDPRYFPDVDVPPLPPNMQEFKSIIVSKSFSEERIPDSYEKWELQWKKIYAVTGDKL